jgi:hypothetical protein
VCTEAQQASQAAEDAERDLEEQVGVAEDADRFADKAASERYAAAAMARF